MPRSTLLQCTSKQTARTWLERSMKSVGFTYCLPIDVPPAILDAELPHSSPKVQNFLVEIRAIAVNQLIQRVAHPKRMSKIRHASSATTQAVQSQRPDLKSLCSSRVTRFIALAISRVPTATPSGNSWGGWDEALVRKIQQQYKPANRSTKTLVQ